MSELTLDEAIKHCFEVAEQNEAEAQKIGVQFLGTTKDREATECRECAADHRQLAEWLTELKEAKRLLKLAVEDFSNVDYHIYECDMDCDSCPIHGERDNCVEWIHADEALKLIEND